uniref:DNA helicase RecQ n=1 Tax=Desulfovibrio sp. U5L TaxID=596152 RepID=I2Q314_9BACT
MPNPRQILKEVFGHDRFLGPQEEIINHVVAGGDALVLMPTGGGKSLCYQIPAMARPGTAIVLSPLIALMRDQVRALDALGARAACLHSGLAPAEARDVLSRLRAGTLDILYAAPERFMTAGFQQLLGEIPLALFAIDEAHCVSQWGHDFRPEYLQLAVIAERFPGVPRMALTATADGPTRKDIQARLHLEEARVFATGFDRPNIRYRVEPKDQPRRRLLRWITDEHPGQSGIVYRLSRKKVEDLAEWLTAQGVAALAYHAGLPPAERDRRQDRFMREEGLVMVATVAFGMGVDKPDVRFVAHLDPPKSMEAYHQETGRAGRDGAPAEALMLYAPADFAALRRLIAPQDGGDGGDGPGGGDSPRKRIELAKLTALAGYCETDACRRQILLGYFGQNLPEPCGNCDVCDDPTEPVDATILAQKALSCVFRTGQRFGARHLVDVLLGKNTTRVVRFGHDAVSTFGIGGEASEWQWQAVYRRLCAMGALAPDAEGHGSLVLTDTAWDILKGRRRFSMRLPAEPERRASRKSRTSEGRTSWVHEHLADAGDAALWERLRAWRSETAKAVEVPPYVVFHDRTLLDVVLLKPGKEADLARAGGMGRAKLEKYGPALLEILAGHYAAHGRGPAREPLAAEAGPAAAPVREPGETAAESLALFRDLGSVAAVAARRGLRPGTVQSHLLAYVRRGELSARAVAGLPDAVAACVEETITALRQAGQVGLGPVHEALSGGIDYDVLRCLEAGLWAAGRSGNGERA